MADLGTLVPVSPLNASDDNRHTFTVDLTESASYALGDTPSDFATMDAASWQVEYRLSGTWVDDTYDLKIRIVNGATILAADDSGGTFQTVALDVQNTTDTTSSVTGFNYENTTADKTAWDGASVEIQQVYTKTKGNDTLSLEVDYVAITGTYTVGGTTHQRTAAIDSVSTVAATATKTSARTASIASVSTVAAIGTVAGDFPVLETDLDAVTSGGASVDNLTLTKPTGTANDDLLVLILGDDAVDTDAIQWNTPTDWTREVHSGSISSDAHITVFTKPADGTELSTINVTRADAQDCFGWYFRASGADGTPVVVALATTSTTGAFTHTVDGVETTFDNALVVAGASFDGGDSGTFTIESGVGWSLVDELHSGITSSDASGVLAQRDQATSGAGVDVVFGADVADGWGSFQLAIAPAGATTHSRSAVINSVSTATAVATLISTRTATIASTSSVTALASVTIPRTAVIASVSTVTATAVVKTIHSRSAVINSVSSVTALSTKRSARASVINSASTVTASATVRSSRSAAINAVSTVTALSGVRKPRTAAISSTSSVTAVATVSSAIRRSAAIVAASTVTAVATRRIKGSAVIASVSSVIATATRKLARSVVIASASTVTAIATVSGNISRSASIAATSAVAAVAARTLRRSAAIASTSSVTAVATVSGVISRSASISATSGVSVTATRRLARVGNIASISTVSAISSNKKKRTAAIASVSLVSANANRRLARIASINAISTVSAVGSLAISDPANIIITPSARAGTQSSARPATVTPIRYTTG